MILVLLIVFGFYSVSMILVMWGCKRVPNFLSKKANSPISRFSIVIPFRNEAENLPGLLKSISNLKYPHELFEIIFVNDSSEDNSEEIILNAFKTNRVSIQMLQNKRHSNSPKKDAITAAIRNATNPWIVTTDADCELPKKWLETFNAFIQSQRGQEKVPVMICAPVIYKSNGNFIEAYQQLDGLSLQAVTIGSFGLNNPILSNGANLAYRKTAFEEVKGFSGNNHLASGDDVFLLEKFRRYFPRQVKFLKSRSSIVSTKSQYSWKGIIQQRIRWASKTSKQKNLLSILFGVLVFLANLAFLMVPVFFIFYPKSWMLFLFLLYLKITTDFMVIRQAADFFDKRVSFWKFQWINFVYSFITIVVVLGSLRGRYSWKNRDFRNI